MNPELHLRIGGDERTCTNRNTRLQTYFGEIALYDNIILVDGDIDEAPEGAEVTIIFKTNNSYEMLKEILLERGFPAYLNLPEVSPGVEQAYLSQFNGDLTDFVPDDWS